jgi:hypothetical protein
MGKLLASSPLAIRFLTHLRRVRFIDPKVKLCAHSLAFPLRWSNFNWWGQTNVSALLTLSHHFCQSQSPAGLPPLHIRLLGDANKHLVLL